MYELDRFLEAQSRIYERALSELRSGKKKSHWMWFIFPQVKGLGRSPKSKYYSIDGIDEAQAYLAHPILGARLLECTNAVLAIPKRPAENFFRKKSANGIFSPMDAVKLKSSMTLFSNVADQEQPFQLVLDKYYSGEKDHRTLEILSR